MKKVCMVSYVVIFGIFAVWLMAYLMHEHNGENAPTPTAARSNSVRAPQAATRAPHKRAASSIRPISIRKDRYVQRSVASSESVYYPISGSNPANVDTYTSHNSVSVRFQTCENDPPEDHAGMWDNFCPGGGNVNKDPADWKWIMTMRLPVPASIQSIEMRHHRIAEAWSTSRNPIYGKASYPLVVFYRGSQINTAYDHELGTYSAGTHEFVLYAQKESTHYYGSTLSVTFSDGVKAQFSFVPPAAGFDEVNPPASSRNKDSRVPATPAYVPYKKKNNNENWLE